MQQQFYMLDNNQQATNFTPDIQRFTHLTLCWKQTTTSYPTLWCLCEDQSSWFASWALWGKEQTPQLLGIQSLDQSQTRIHNYKCASTNHRQEYTTTNVLQPITDKYACQPQWQKNSVNSDINILKTATSLASKHRETTNDFEWIYVTSNAMQNLNLSFQSIIIFNN